MTEKAVSLCNVSLYSCFHTWLFWKEEKKNSLLCIQQKSENIQLFSNILKKNEITGADDSAVNSLEVMILHTGSRKSVEIWALAGRIKHLEALWYDSAPSNRRQYHAVLLCQWLLFFIYLFFPIASLISLYAKWSDAPKAPAQVLIAPVSDALGVGRASRDATQQQQKRRI